LNDYRIFLLLLTQDDGPSPVTKLFVICYTPSKCNRIICNNIINLCVWIVGKETVRSWSG